MTNTNWFNPAVENSLLAHQSPENENGYFVYQIDALKEHLQTLQQQDVVKLWFAVKANPLSKIIQTLDGEGFDFDVASEGELSQVIQQGIDPKRVLNTGPAKSKKQLTSFIKKGVNTFVVESINQLNWLNEVIMEERSLGNVVKPRVLLRVQLQWQEGEKNPLGGNDLTPFGLSVSEWQHIHVSNYPSLDICGLHIFQWGNMLCNEKMFSLWSQMISPLQELAQSIGMCMEVLDLGGGLGIDYLMEGKALNWLTVINDLKKIKEKAGVTELWLELGRFAVAECGYYVVPVVDRKINYGQQQLVLAAGINHLLRPAITDQPFPVRVLRSGYSADNQIMQTFDLHGPLCTSMDKLGQLALPEDVAVGEHLVFGYCGAYGFTESMPFFLCHQLAAEYVFENRQLTVIRTAKPASSYLA